MCILRVYIRTKVLKVSFSFQSNTSLLNVTLKKTFTHRFQKFRINILQDPR